MTPHDSSQGPGRRPRAVRSTPSNKRLEVDVDDELRFHMEERIAEWTAQGMSREEAERHVRAAFGDVGRYRSETLAIDAALARRRNLFDVAVSFGRDLSHALRVLRRQPIFSLTAIVTLALGIGATTTIFSLLDVAVLRPLPYSEPEQLVRLRHPVPGVVGQTEWNLAIGGYQYFSTHASRLDGLGVYYREAGSLVADGQAEQVNKTATSASLFTVLRLQPALGQVFTSEANVPGNTAVVVLGHAFWQRRFGGDSGVVGRQLTLDGRSVHVIGVLRPRADGPAMKTDVWIPLTIDPKALPQNSHAFPAIARLKPGVTVEGARDELSQLLVRFPDEMPSAYSPSFMEKTGFTISLTPLRDDVIGGFGRISWLLMASVLLVLVVACANVANLFAVRAQGRVHETAVRLALGARTGHLVSRDAAEAGMVALLAATLGVAAAWWVVRILVVLAPDDIPRLDEIAIGSHAVLFAFAMAVLVTVVFGIGGGGRGFGRMSALPGGARGATASRVRHRTRAALVVTQTALALVLLAGAGLMIRSVLRLSAVKPGFDPNHVLAFDLSIPWSRYGGWEKTGAFWRELQRRIAEIPGVESVGAAQELPLSGNVGCASLHVQGKPLGPGEQPPCVHRLLVSPDYFDVMRIPLRGTAPDWNAMEVHSAGVVVSAGLARRFWPGEEALGGGVKSNGAEPPFYEVQGVTGDVLADGLDRPPSEIVYFPMLPKPGASLWSPPMGMSVVMRVRGDAGNRFWPLIRRTVSEMDPDLPIANLRSMDEVVQQSFGRVSFIMLLMSVAGGMALLLSVVGLYGVVSYIVSQRRQEIGVRMALGADARQVGRLVVFDSLRLSGLGVAIGIVLAMAAGGAMRSLLFGVETIDPLSLGLVSAGLLLVALVASLIPARRAARVDPASALRSD